MKQWDHKNNSHNEWQVSRIAIMNLCNAISSEIPHELLVQQRLTFQSIANQNFIRLTHNSVQKYQKNIVEILKIQG